MIEPRAPLESEVPELIGFLDKNLRSDKGWSIASEYPHVFTAHNRNNIRIVTEGSQVVAHAAVKYLFIKNIMGIFKVAAIGSVLTDPQYRHQGYSQKVLESCITAAEAEGADFAILWSDLYDFYHKLDFELAGSEVSLVIENNLPVQTPAGLKFLKSDKVSPDAILRLYSQHTCGTIRTSEDIRKSLQIPNTNVYSAWSASNDLLAYAVEGKGVDLKGYIHEWGGGVNSLLPLLAHIRKDLNMPITVIAPSHAQNLIRHLQEWDVIVNHGFLGMIRPLNYQNLFFKISRYARQLGIHDLVLEKNEKGFIIGTRDDYTVLTSNADLTKLLFGPVEKDLLKPKFQKLLPIPMWVWGWDSV